MNMDQIIDLVQMFENVCYSGGADGADRLFGLYAHEIGHPAIHFSFAKHKFHVDEEEVLELPQSILSSTQVLNKVKLANQSLGRSVPKVGSYVYNLLARNSFQVACTERLYTIGELVSPSQLDGGTAWAVQMYMDEHPYREIYHFNISDQLVYKYDNKRQEFVPVQNVPAPHGRWTGIGSRRATEQDMNAFKSKFI